MGVREWGAVSVVCDVQSTARVRPVTISTRGEIWKDPDDGVSILEVSGRRSHGGHENGNKTVGLVGKYS